MNQFSIDVEYESKYGRGSQARAVVQSISKWAEQG